MSRKVYLTLKIPVIIEINEGVNVHDIIGDLNCEVTYNGDEDVEIYEVEMSGYEITDSK